MRKSIAPIALIFLLGMVSESSALVSIQLQSQNPAVEFNQETLVSLRRLIPFGGDDVKMSSKGDSVLLKRTGAVGWNQAVSLQERTQLLNGLRARWGERITIVENVLSPTSAAAPAPAWVPKRKPLFQMKSASKAIAANRVGASASKQNLYYDGANTRSGMNAVSGSQYHGRAAFRAAPIKQKGLHIKATPAPAKPKMKISWGRAAWESAKGAGHVVKSLFTWKGAAMAVGAVALTVAVPAAAWGLLAVGIGMGVYQMGKGIYNARKAYKAGDEKKFYESAQTFGGGALTTGLSVFGLKYAPKNLHAHVPKGWADWKAPLATMDNLGVIGNVIGRSLSREEAAAAVIGH